MTASAQKVKIFIIAGLFIFEALLLLNPVKSSAFKVFRGEDTTATLPLFRDISCSPGAGLYPFEHWDARMFANNQVPWSLDTSTTTEVSKADVLTAVQASFQAWEDTTPSIIRFTNVGGQNGTDTIPATRDNWNIISWQSGGDDTTGTTTLTATGDSTLAVLPGPDGWLETEPGGDDIYWAEPDNVISAGGNNTLDSNLNNVGVGNWVGLSVCFFNNRTGEILESSMKKLLLSSNQY